MTRFAVLVAATLAVAPWAAAATHPRLVKVEATNCTVCHDEVVEGAVVHPPVADDCTTCHEFDIGDEGTTVDLTGEEPDLCVMCHDGVAAAAAGEIDAPHAPVMDSCQNCHEVHASGQEHLLLVPPVELCVMCHDSGDLQSSHGGQITEATDCRSCHLSHGGDATAMLRASHQHAPFADGSCDACHREPYGDRIRLTARGEKVCSACHGDLREEVPDGGSVHAALTGDRRRAGCLSCHNPHMSEQASLLVAPGPELCAACHSEVVAGANAETGHAPAAEDCLNCHMPHTAGEAHLLDSGGADLCLMCHDADDADLGAAHLGADVGGLDCGSCHSPHGAGSPDLLAANVHAPILDGCDTCHEGAADVLMEDGESTLCLACHDDVGESAGNAAVPHAAIEMARCADCHSPHASPNTTLLVQPGGGVCTECHDDKAAAEGEHAHGVIDLIGCQACHEPHGSANEFLLRADAVELCLECHDSSRLDRSATAVTTELLGRFEVPIVLARQTANIDLDLGHPVIAHLANGTPSEDELKRTETTHVGDLNCLTCHDPHKGRSAMLLLWGAGSRMDACMHCHPK